VVKNIYVGTSGWQISHSVGSFYPHALASSDRLNFYSRHLNSVEINSTFKSYPKSSTMEKRYSETPGDFKFAIKAHKDFTHIHPMTDPEENWSRFFDSLKCLGEKLGPVLFQFAPSFRQDLKLLKNWLKTLDKDFKYAFEFRNPSWFCAKTYHLLKSFDAALCISDFRTLRSPYVSTATWGYFRLHGPLILPYRGSYDSDALTDWAQVACSLFKDKVIYAFLDNTMSGCAPQNALDFSHILHTNIK
jgi:uncharacterized protein YecE (DUF72 family)